MNKQQEAINLIDSGADVFVTGAGGTGKSWLIDQVRSERVVITAPTGIAALNVQGTTCHSAFGLPIGLPQRKDHFVMSKKFKTLFGKESPTETIIIDEIGTLRADYLDLINKKLQHLRDSHEQWGGLQMVVVGDLFQLSPIVSGKEREHYFDKYWSAFPFAANSWNFKAIELDVIHRQKNPMHVQVLESIRRGNSELADAIYIVNSLSARAHIEGSLRLCCYNADADAVNHREYLKVHGDEHEFEAVTQGNWGRDEPVPKDLKLKIGTRVLVCANGEGHVNGDRGEVEKIKDSSVIVRKDDGIAIEIKPKIWEKYTYERGEDGLQRDVEATYTQFPLRHGWAVSIHKSQGMTLDGVTIDIGRGCFAHGQFYVALSRCRDLENVNFVTPPSVGDVKVDPAVKSFYNSLETVK